MFRVLVYFLLILSLSQCNDKKVLLPLIPLDGIPEIGNHSSIWIFFETSGQDTLALLNKNNKLINTNWIFNVDRRLSMKRVIPKLEEMQKDRNKDSMHKKEGMKNFFSYANTQSQLISLIPFPQTEFKSMTMPDEKSDSSRCLIPVKILGEQLELLGKRISADETSEIQKLVSTCDTTQVISLQLRYNENLSYQHYLSARAYLASTELPIDPTEINYTLK